MPKKGALFFLGKHFFALFFLGRHYFCLLFLGKCSFLRFPPPKRTFRMIFSIGNCGNVCRITIGDNSSALSSKWCALRSKQECFSFNVKTPTLQRKFTHCAPFGWNSPHGTCRWRIGELYVVCCAICLLERGESCTSYGNQQTFPLCTLLLRKKRRAFFF